jgi:hypothetical protein
MQGGGILIAETDAALADRNRTGQTAQQGGFTRAGLANDGDEFSRSNGGGDLFQGLFGFKAPADTVQYDARRIQHTAFHAGGSSSPGGTASI